MTANKTRPAIITLVVVLVLGTLAWWIRNSIEWVDIDVRTPLSEPVQHDRFATAKALIRQLGGSSDSRASLAALPPPKATLVLATRHWTLFPERVLALERWVRGGGRLVLLPDALGEAAAKVRWLPVRVIDVPRRQRNAASAAAGASAPSSDDEDDDGEAMPDPEPPAAADAPAPGASAARSRADASCQLLREPSAAMAAYGTPRVYRVCGYSGNRLRQASVTPTWALDLADGSTMLRAPLGQGSVTISTLDFSFVGNRLLDYDGALAFAAALSLHAGDLVWFIADEKHATLLARIWEGGKSVVLLAALALALALWRGATRFGPLAATPSSARRSIGEQIRRTAAFVAGGGGGALHRASVRALEEAARRSIPGYAALVAAADRARAIAVATGLDAGALAAAIAFPGRIDAASALSARRRVGAAVGLLEQARRALLAQTTHDTSTPRRASP